MGIQIAEVPCLPGGDRFPTRTASTSVSDGFRFSPESRNDWSEIIFDCAGKARRVTNWNDASSSSVGAAMAYRLAGRPDRSARTCLPPSLRSPARCHLLHCTSAAAHLWLCLLLTIRLCIIPCRRLSARLDYHSVYSSLGVVNRSNN